MQGIGHVIVNDEKIKVLARDAKTYRSMKIRKTGKDGNFFKDESDFLSFNLAILNKLKNGDTIYL